MTNSSYVWLNVSIQYYISKTHPFNFPDTKFIPYYVLSNYALMSNNGSYLAISFHFLIILGYKMVLTAILICIFLLLTDAAYSTVLTGYLMASHWWKACSYLLLFLPELFSFFLHVLMIWFCQFWEARPKQVSDKVETGSQTTGRASYVPMFSWLHPSEWHADRDTVKLRYKTRYSGWSFLSLHFNISSAKKKLRRCQHILLVAYKTISRCQVLNRPQFRQCFHHGPYKFIYSYILPCLPLI